MTISSRTKVLAGWLLAAASALLLFPQSSVAQASAEKLASLERLRPPDFPDKPIEVVVGFPPGGGMDVHTRILVKYMQQVSGHAFVVVNKPGATGFIGHSHVRNARPDGYTIGAVTGNMFADNILRAKGKWSLQDIVPLAFINYDRLTWLVSTNSDLQSLTDVIAAAKKSPGGLHVAAGNETASGFLAEQVQSASGTKLNSIPFSGGKASLQALLGGHIDVAFGYYSEFRTAMEAGKVRAVGVAGATRAPQMPQVPTFNEVLGTNDAIWDSFRFLITRKEVAPERLRWLEAVANAALDLPELEKEQAELGVQLDRSLNTSDRISTEIERRMKLEREFYVRSGRLAN